MFRKFLSLSLVFVVLSQTCIFSVSAVSTNSSAAPWTREKAEQLARKTLFGATPAMIDSLYIAGSAAAAVNVLFPDTTGPDRTTFNAEMSALTSGAFNWGNGASAYQYYQYRLARDPYEAKAKLWALFEDIFSVNQNGSTIVFRDVQDLHDTLYSETLGNYKNMVKKVLFNGTSGDYAEGKFLDLLDQSDKRYPNENYARELMQLFLMGEYEPGKSKDNGDTRNYEETDVAAFAKVLTGFRSDSVTHRVSYDRNYHNTSTGVLFLSGGTMSASFPFYNSASGTLDLNIMDTPIMGNNGLADNAVDFVFAKRSRQIAYFLADRLFRFYIHDNPTRSDLDPIVTNILSNNFDLLPTVKSLLASDVFYSDTAMNTLSYKNPLELTIGTIKLLHASDPTVLDPLLKDTSLLTRFNWTPYIPGSVFGRDGYDKNAKWYSTYIENQWMSYANSIAYATSSGSYLPTDILGNPRRSVTGVFMLDTLTSKTLSGPIALGSGSVLLAGSTGALTYGPNTFSFPDVASLFSATGGLVIASGSIDLNTNKISVSSGSYTLAGTTYPIASADFDLVSGSTNLTRDMNATEIIDRLESTILLGRHLPDTVRTRIATYISTSETGAIIAVNPSNAEYVRRKVRGAIALVLAQPEYVLQTGYDAAVIPDGSSSSPVSATNNRLLFVELPGGYDWLHGVIPKNEYSNYVTKRTVGTGTIALDTGRLTDLGDYYLNNAIAYGSGGAASFKSLYDAGNLRIFNRVGTPNHSRDHDAAQKQIASYASTTLADGDGVFGRLVKDHLEDMDTISLTGRLPNVFRNGRYVNIGPSGAIISHPYTNSKPTEATATIDTMKAIINERSYPGKVAGVFRGAVKVDDVARRSKQAGGLDGAGYGNVNNLNFLRTLLTNNTGKTFYMQADGGYDTHSNQLAPQSNFDPNNIPKDLNYNIGRVAENLTKFFNDVKDTQNITIVVYSEFGRTTATNGDLGTDHGEGGGMFVLSNNSNFLSSVPNKISGNLSFQNSHDGWLGVGVDYRAVYGKIFSALYGVSPTDYFTEHVALEDNISLDAPTFSLARTEIRPVGNNVWLKLRFNLGGKTYDPRYSSYFTVEYGTGFNNLKKASQWNIDNSSKQPDGSYLYDAGSLTQASSYVYRVTAYSNQYVTTVLTGSLTIPSIVGSSGTGANTISRVRDSVVTAFNNMSVTGTASLAGTGLIIANNGTGSTLRIPGRDGVTIETHTGLTAVQTVTSASGTRVWNGGFILGESVNPDTFVYSGATIVGSGSLTRDRIARIIKVGSDTIGVGMRLNKAVTLEYTGLSGSTLYSIVSSEDGVNWTPHGSGSVSTDAVGTIRFPTDHFTYFAFLPPVVVPVTPSTPTTPVVVSSGGGGGGGGWLSRDYCPNGDYSASYYDGQCGTVPVRQTATGMIMNTGTTSNVTASNNTPVTISGLFANPVIAGYDFSKNEKIPQKVAAELNYVIQSVYSGLMKKAGNDPKKQQALVTALSASLSKAANSSTDVTRKRVFAYLEKRLAVIAKKSITIPVSVSTQSVPVATVAPPVTSPTTPVVPSMSLALPENSILFASGVFDGYDFSASRRLPRAIVDAVDFIGDMLIRAIDAKYSTSVSRISAYNTLVSTLNDRIASTSSDRDHKLLTALKNRIYTESEKLRRGVR